MVVARRNDFYLAEALANERQRLGGLRLAHLERVHITPVYRDSRKAQGHAQQLQTNAAGESRVDWSSYCTT